MRPVYLHFICLALGLILVWSGCTNPFAPKLGEAGGSVIPDANTIGGMLELFRYSYNTKDSLYYSQLLDSSFVFEYYDAANSRYDQWYRTTDLKATAGMFNAYDVIDLNWYSLIDTSLWSFAGEGIDTQIVVNYNLTIDNIVLFGFARFDCYKKTGSKFKITAWKDDF